MRVAFFMLGVLLLPLALPGAVAWRADGWLIQDVVGGERLRLGDEFGCHGMPGKDVNTDLSVISECKEYLTSQINASKWGSEPLSFGLPGGVIEFETMDALMDENFLILGGNEFQPMNSSAPQRFYDLEIVEQSGGSLEKNIASIDTINAGINEHGYANLYWEAQIEDLNVRRDRDVLEWIESQDFWFTTWGELYSSSHSATESERTNQSITLKGSAAPNGAWDVPGTTRLVLDGGQITSIERLDDGEFSQLTISNHHLKTGYRIIENSSATLTIEEGAYVRVTWQGEVDDVYLLSGTFNNLTPFMVTGHHTTDLFEWSSPFQDEDKYEVIEENKLSKNNVRQIYDYVLNGMHYGKPKSVDNQYYKDPWLNADGKYGLKEVSRDEVVNL